ncbi:MAG: hypothetical protein AC479_00010 [miscellaneous Crenarchaeota group-6 archaeon AD8-1]|nr:MAG: hypothetical protein AC479_00010 [miscellaneous Crenarchaeota group-6 archaeon AD8-1]
MSTENTPEKAPGWFRALSVILGILILILAFAVIAFPELGLLTIVIWISLTLIVAGIELLVVGVGLPDLSSGGRALMVIGGIAMLALGFIAWFYPNLTIAVQLILFAVGLIVGGAATAAMAGMSPKMPKLSKGIVIVLGILAVVLAISVIVWPAFGETILVILLVIGLLLQGVHALIVGLIGE